MPKSPKKGNSGIKHIGMPEKIYLDHGVEDGLFSRKRGMRGNSMRQASASEKSIRGSGAVFYWLARGALKEQLRGGRISPEEFRDQHMKLRQAIKNRHPILVRAGEVVSPVFSHDFVGVPQARGALGPLWFKKKPAIDSEPIHIIEENGKRWAVNRTHWALFKKPFKEDHVVAYPATKGHGPTVMKRKKAERGYKAVETADLPVFDINDLIKHGGRYIEGGGFRGAFKDSASRANAERRARAAINRLKEERGELPTWAERSKGLRLRTPFGRTTGGELKKMLRA